MVLTYFNQSHVAMIVSRVFDCRSWKFLLNRAQQCTIVRSIQCKWTFPVAFVVVSSVVSIYILYTISIRFIIIIIAKKICCGSTYTPFLCMQCILFKDEFVVCSSDAVCGTTMITLSLHYYVIAIIISQHNKMSAFP